jgi:hypothetical protein
MIFLKGQNEMVKMCWFFFTHLDKLTSYANNGSTLLMCSFVLISSIVYRRTASFSTSTYIHNNQPVDATIGQISCKQHVMNIMKKPNIHFFDQH